MASNRHLGRIVALQTLYEFEFRTEVGDVDVSYMDILDRNLGKYKSLIKDIDFVKSLVAGVLADVTEIDNKLRPLAPDWPLDQISRVDRAILRLGLYELAFSDYKVPHKVVINEAVELAKAFGSDNSGKFVNGVLGTAYRTLEGNSEDENEQL